MNLLESLLLAIGFSWQLSRFLPFCILLLITLVLLYFLWKRTRSFQFKWLVFTLIGFVPCAIYFAFYPIYQSDIKNDYRIVLNEMDSIRTINRFEIIALPNCPHCVSSVDLISRLKKRNTKLSIQYRILSISTKVGELEKHLKQAQIEYSIIQTNSKLRKLTKGSYPTYIFHVKNKKNIRVWNNNTFGTKALDYIESCL